VYANIDDVVYLVDTKFQLTQENVSGFASRMIMDKNIEITYCKYHLIGLHVCVSSCNSTWTYTCQ